MTENGTSDRFERVARVASAVQLEEVRLRYITSVLGIPNPDDLPNDWASSVKLEHDVDVLDDDADDEAPIEGDIQSFFVLINFRAEYDVPVDEEGTAEERGEDEPPDFGLFATFELAYRLEDESGTLIYGDIRAFAELNAVFNCWPYWRELAQSVSQRMNLTHPLIVPLRTARTLIPTK
jgi:hypothetical protein